MTSRDCTILGLVMIALVVLLWFANVRFIYPGLTPQLPEPAAIPPEETYKAPVDTNIVATTLEKIRTMFPQKKFDTGFEPRRVARNPFLWPEEISGERYKPGLLAEKEDEERGLPRLNMIIIGENRKIALINDQLVFEGTRINGDTVHKIKEKEVVLRGDTGETRISMAEYTFAPAIEEELPPPEKAPITPAQTETIDSLFEKLKPLLQSGP